MQQAALFFTHWSDNLLGGCNTSDPLAAVAAVEVEQYQYQYRTSDIFCLKI